MRGKLIIFVLLLAVSGLATGWWFARDSAFFDGESLPASLRRFSELQNLPEHDGIPLPDEVRVALTNASVSQIKIAVDGPATVTVDTGRLKDGAIKKTVVAATSNGFQIGQNVVNGTTLEIVPNRSPAIWVDDRQ
jgi:hypothetical protein